MPPPKYKVCKNCGNRNHPASRQCPWCGAALPSPMDWFSRLGLLLIALVLVALVIYSHQNRPPSPSGRGAAEASPDASRAAE